jgi:hypothetical protein
MQDEKSMDYPKSPLGEIQGIFTSLHEYRSIIEKRLYHFLLCDGATFQFRYIIDHDQIIQHRLCYYPCPVRITSDDLENISYGEDFLLAISCGTAHYPDRI